ncbi:hypothetical protein KCV00_g335, partial [Aureobasidium melanogenum]
MGEIEIFIDDSETGRNDGIDLWLSPLFYTLALIDQKTECNYCFNMQFGSIATKLDNIEFASFCLKKNLSVLHSATSSSSSTSSST